VQIEQKHSCNTPPCSAAISCDATVAQAHSALFPTQLALARWTYGGDTPHVHSYTRHMPRAAWYAQAQRQFQSWLDAGGFHQPEAECTDSATRDGWARRIDASK
jgi:hypothetical protein